MKRKILLFLCLLPFCAFSENYASLTAEGAKAYKAQNFAAALEKYTAAHKLANSAASKFRIIPVQITLYMRLKKTAELEKFLEQERQDDSYSNTQKRYLLNWSAKIHVWPKRDMRYAMVLLTMARLIPVSKADNTYFETFFLMGEIFRRNKQYDYLIYYLAPLPGLKEFHPSNSYKISMMLAQAYRSKGDRKQALQWAQKALAFGKKVPYKYNYSEAQRYIKELSR
ncbi:MAG: hypothetical protein IKA87_09035 [Lentisphaeria bacterium]|nr:hypothetical protein [Lentisphaeria bacterium]